jgi:hypothetical protein
MSRRNAFTPQSATVNLVHRSLQETLLMPHKYLSVRTKLNMHLNAEPPRSESSELKPCSNFSKERRAILYRSIRVLMAEQSPTSPTGPSGNASKTIRSYSHGIAIPCRRQVSPLRTVMKMPPSRLMRLPTGVQELGLPYLLHPAE